MGAAAGHWIGVTAFGLLVVALPASAEEPPVEEARQSSPVLLRPQVPAEAAAAAAQRRVPSPRLGFADAGLGVSVVELPAQGVQLGPQQRRHHAFSFATEGPRNFFRSLGVDATDCSTRIRFPSRLHQSNQGIKAEMQGQVQLGCSF